MTKPRLPLSKREDKVWTYILGYFADNEYSPTRQEIADGVGFNHRNEATKCVNNMVKKGWLKTKKNEGRNIIDPKLYETKRNKISKIFIKRMERR